MKAGLIHFYSTKNVGDAAILAALEKLVGDKLSAIDYDAEQSAREHDLLISVGGDIFNNARPQLITRRLLNKFKQLRWSPERTILFGQSIPPSCRGIAFRALAHHLRSIASVTVRDPLSYERLRAVGVNVDLSVDSVFALNSGYADTAGARGLFESQNISPQSTAVFSIRNFGKMYPIDERDFRAKISQTLKSLNENGWQVAILLQADVDENDTDLTLAKDLQNEVQGLKILDPFRAGVEPWRVALGVTAMAKTVIGTRYHTNIFRMVSGGMPVGLWYSNKGEDLNARFGVPGANAGSFHPDEIVYLAEKAAGQDFDASGLQAQVVKDFDAALKRVQHAGGYITSRQQSGIEASDNKKEPLLA